MEIEINQIVDYYAGASVSFSDAFTARVPPGCKATGQWTSATGGGFVIPLSGSARFTIDGTPYILKPGIIVHGGPGMPLEKEVVGEEDWIYALIHYKLPREETRRWPLYNRHFSMYTGVNSRIGDLVVQLLQTQAVPGGMAAVKSKTLFMNILEEILFSAKRQLQDENSDAIIRAAEYIRNHYAEPISIAKMALQSGLERRRFAYMFEKHTGMSPISYLPLAASTGPRNCCGPAAIPSPILPSR
ncbi:AraC family transcriptional regulator [Paenibacillus sp. YN15]|uniref:AraC family transcriptional regulator n=1 Tax=Paenibacillus sp. YN15 TaxID=1742774 RepID=UPI00215C0C6A|nr:AraC family transcriptional regulator [Paenibacillus sp. YN15]